MASKFSSFLAAMRGLNSFIPNNKSFIIVIYFYGEILQFDQLLIYASFVQKILIFTQSKFDQFGESLLLQNKRKGH